MIECLNGILLGAIIEAIGMIIGVILGLFIIKKFIDFSKIKKRKIYK